MNDISLPQENESPSAYCKRLGAESLQAVCDYTGVLRGTLESQIKSESVRKQMSAKAYVLATVCKDQH